ncbi:hypothetical protein TWF481_010601 [Arthrobotrys musiformis]|uniref:Uncharacterized protein n=1 Tax=Arthrobotrys musiformis TaxID=47236 RepID=A0AAV9W2K1_9PEZI
MPINIDIDHYDSWDDDPLIPPPAPAPASQPESDVTPESGSPEGSELTDQGASGTGDRAARDAMRRRRAREARASAERSRMRARDEAARRAAQAAAAARRAGQAAARGRGPGPGFMYPPPRGLGSEHPPGHRSTITIKKERRYPNLQESLKASGRYFVETEREFLVFSVTPREVERIKQRALYDRPPDLPAYDDPVMFSGQSSSEDDDEFLSYSLRLDLEGAADEPPPPRILHPVPFSWWFDVALKSSGDENSKIKSIFHGGNVPSGQRSSTFLRYFTAHRKELVGPQSGQSGRPEIKKVISSRRSISAEVKDDTVKLITACTANPSGRPTNIDDIRFRWIHFQNPTLNLEDFKEQVLNISGLEDHDLTILWDLFERVKDKMERTYIHGKYLEGGAIRCDGKSGKECSSATFIAMPVLKLQPLEVPSILKGQRSQPKAFQSSDHAPRPLMQTTANMASTLDRDKKQATFSSKLVPRDQAIHVVQTWILVINDKLLVTHSPSSLKDIAGPNIQFEDGQQDEGFTIRVGTNFDGAHYLAGEKCQTWFEFQAELKKVVRTPTYLPYKEKDATISLKDGTILGPQNWAAKLGENKAKLFRVALELKDNRPSMMPPHMRMDPPGLGSHYAPRSYVPSPYASRPYAPGSIAPSPYAPSPYAPSPYASNPYALNPYTPSPYAPSSYAPSYAAGSYPPATAPTVPQSQMISRTGGVDPSGDSDGGAVAVSKSSYQRSGPPSRRQRNLPPTRAGSTPFQDDAGPATKYEGRRSSRPQLPPGYVERSSEARPTIAPVPDPPTTSAPRRGLGATLTDVVDESFKPSRYAPSEVGTESEDNGFIRRPGGRQPLSLPAPPMPGERVSRPYSFKGDKSAHSGDYHGTEHSYRSDSETWEDHEETDTTESDTEEYPAPPPFRRPTPGVIPPPPRSSMPPRRVAFGLPSTMGGSVEPMRTVPNSGYAAASGPGRPYSSRNPPNPFLPPEQQNGPLGSRDRDSIFYHLPDEIIAEKEKEKGEEKGGSGTDQLALELPKVLPVFQWPTKASGGTKTMDKESKFNFRNRSASRGSKGHKTHKKSQSSNSPVSPTIIEASDESYSLLKDILNDLNRRLESSEPEDFRNAYLSCGSSDYIEVEKSLKEIENTNVASADSPMKAITTELISERRQILDLCRKILSFFIPKNWKDGKLVERLWSSILQLVIVGINEDSRPFCTDMITRLESINRHIQVIVAGVAGDSMEDPRYRIPSALFESFLHFAEAIIQASVGIELLRGGLPPDMRKVVELDRAHRSVETTLDACKSSLRKGKFQIMCMILTGRTKDQMNFEEACTETIVSFILRHAISEPITKVEAEPSPINIYLEKLTNIDLEAKYRPDQKILQDILYLGDQVTAFDDIRGAQSKVLSAADVLLHPKGSLDMKDPRSPYSLAYSSPRDRMGGGIEYLFRQERDYMDDYGTRASALYKFVEEAISLKEEDNGKAIMVFTIVTTVFLPLNFVTSFFGMNTTDIRDIDRDQRIFWTTAIPVTILVLGFALTWAYIGDTIQDRLFGPFPFWGKLFRGRLDKHRAKWVRKLGSKEEEEDDPPPSYRYSYPGVRRSSQPPVPSPVYANGSGYQSRKTGNAKPRRRRNAGASRGKSGL